MRRKTFSICSFWLVLALAIAACGSGEQHSSASSTLETQGKPTVVNPKKVVAGQTVYVPIYSHIYQFNNRSPVMNLSATLSIRNADLTNSLIVTAVRYYSSTGELVRTYLQTPIELRRLASADCFIAVDDTSGGLGANFIVEWVAEAAITEPVIEAVMINTAGNQGISFVSSGRVIKRHVGKQGANP